MVPVQTQRPENKGANGVSPSLSPKAWEPAATDKQKQEKTYKAATRREWIHLSSDILFSLGYQWIGWCPSALVRSVFFTQFTDSSANLFRGHTDTARNVLSAIWASHKINHHRDTMFFHGQTHYCKDIIFLQINLYGKSTEEGGGSQFPKYQDTIKLL